MPSFPPDVGRPTEARYRAIVEDQPDLVCRFQAGGTLTFANDAYCAFFNLRREEVVGRPYRPFVHPDDAERVRAMVASLSPANPIGLIENRVFRGDGEVRWTEWSNRAIFDDAGRLVEFQSTGRDITERKRNDETAARLAAIVASADVAIYSTTLDGLITSWNRAAEKMFGYTAADVTGRPIAILMPPDVGVEALDIPSRVRRGETIEHIEIEKLTSTGRRIPISLTVSPIIDASGQIIGISRIARDITALAEAMRRESEARAAAEEASRLKDEFLAIVSHELRTPLNAILGWSHMLRAGTVPADGVARALDAIDRNARIQAQLVEDLLDVSRIISGKMTMRLASVDLGQVVRAAIDVVRPAAVNKSIDLHIEIAPAIAVWGDAARLQQAVWNLLVNAVKFTPRGGRVDVSLTAVDADAILTVRDTGVGISAAALPSIFDRFRQADSRTTRAHGGLGLGLTIVDYVVHAHGGSVEARSDGPGQGATFVLALPIRVAAARSTASSGTTADRPDLSGRRILVVDDDVDALDLTRIVLSQCGADVTTAGSVAAALAALDERTPDILIGDIGMPGQDGFDLIRLVRARHTHPIPALALTAYSSPQHRDAALRAGYDAHLGKPVDPDVLCAVVDQLARAASPK